MRRWKEYRRTLVEEVALQALCEGAEKKGLESKAGRDTGGPTGSTGGTEEGFHISPGCNAERVEGKSVRES